MGQQETEGRHAHQVVEQLQGILPKGRGRGLDARDEGELHRHKRKADEASTHAEGHQWAGCCPVRVGQDGRYQWQQHQEQIQPKP
jgi:hypothetical protein